MVSKDTVALRAVQMYLSENMKKIFIALNVGQINIYANLPPEPMGQKENVKM